MNERIKMNRTKHEKTVIQDILSIILFSFLLTTQLVTTAGASELVILYSNDILGEIEPCG